MNRNTGKNRNLLIDGRSRSLSISVRVDAASSVSSAEADARCARFLHAVLRFRRADEAHGYRFIDPRTGETLPAL